jgi:hypothetical protein
MSGEQASLLPAGVFECSTPGGLSRQEFAWEAEDPRTKEKRTVKVSVRAGEVGKAATAAGEGGEPQDAEFCDASSKSLSGYMDLKGSDYDKNGEDKHLFFWMFEKRPSAAEPDLPSGGGGGGDASTPFVVWLTGGPGCSSTLALLTENGPCSVNEDGKTTSVNPHSWTEAAHVLWLDQPAGVGFSYGDADDSDEQMVAEDAYWFLQAFFKSYPEYGANPLFIIGESYAGEFLVRPLPPLVGYGVNLTRCVFVVTHSPLPPLPPPSFSYLLREQGTTCPPSRTGSSRGTRTPRKARSRCRCRGSPSATALPTPGSSTPGTPRWCGTTRTTSRSCPRTCTRR